jgi:hypothetical protein
MNELIKTCTIYVPNTYAIRLGISNSPFSRIMLLI